VRQHHRAAIRQPVTDGVHRDTIAQAARSSMAMSFAGKPPGRARMLPASGWPSGRTARPSIVAIFLDLLVDRIRRLRRRVSMNFGQLGAQLLVQIAFHDERGAPIDETR